MLGRGRCSGVYDPFDWIFSRGNPILSWLTIAINATSNRLRSMICPSPVRSRWNSAARMPLLPSCRSKHQSRHTDLSWFAIGITSHRHDSGHGLKCDIVSCSDARGPVWPYPVILQNFTVKFLRVNPPLQRTCAKILDNTSAQSIN